MQEAGTLDLVIPKAFLKDLVIKDRWAECRLLSLHVVKVIAAFKLSTNVNTKLASVNERDM